MEDLQKIKEFFSKPLKEERDIYDEIANEEFGMDYDQLGPNEKEWVRDEVSNMDEAVTAAYESGKEKNKSVKEGNHNAEDFKPYVVKDSNNPNFLRIFVQYPTGTGFTTALGQKTMTGQDRDYNAYKAMKIGQAVAAKLDSKYNLEDIEVSDNEAGKVIIFAVSDDFIKMNTPSIDEAKEETGVDMAKKRLDALGVKYEMSKTDKVRPFKVIYRPINKSDKFYDEFEDIVDLFNLKGFVKTSMEEAKFMSGLLSGKDFINAKLKNYPKAKAKINQLIDMIGEDKFTIEMAEWIFDFFNNASFESPVNEAKLISDYKVGDIISFKDGEDWKVIKVKDNIGKLVIKPHNEKAKKGNVSLEINIDADYLKKNLLEAKSEDKVDTITMDVPLFLRILEYSREDAQKDIDLHDVTDKAISLGKERGILSMEDYEEIVGGAEEIDENLTEAYVPSNIKEFAKRKGVSSLVNKVAGWAERIGQGIRGGTAIGYNYSTLVLDMTYQGSEIRINTDNDTVTLYDEPVRSFGEFQRVFADGADNNLEEGEEEQLSFISKARAKSSLKQFLSGKRDDGMGRFDAIVYGIDSDGKKHQIKYYNHLQDYEKFALGDNPDIKENVAPNHDGKAAPYGSGYKPLEERIAKALEKINEDLCPAGKAYIKRRQAAGEKSSAYLSGRAVKVCKGQMSGRAKKK